jgi:hypoxanthine phosphoribosyltransferase
MTELIQLHDLHFKPYLTEEAIQQRVAEIGTLLSKEYAGRKPVFMVMLKGAFVFATDLVRYFDGPAEVSFVRTQSYIGTETTQDVKIILGPTPEEVQGRDIIIVEDIVDSGHTMNRFLPILEAQQPRSISLVSLLVKPEMLQKEVKIDHVGFSIPPKFVVGYGLDYNGLGRNIRSIYQLAEEMK